MSKLMLYCETLLLAQKFDQEGYCDEAEELRGVAHVFGKEHFEAKDIDALNHWKNERFK